MLKNRLYYWPLVNSFKCHGAIKTNTGSCSEDISNTGTLAPVLTRIVTMSIESSTVPKVMKHAVVTPLLKKTGLYPDSLSNYRPISNLSFISNLLERKTIKNYWRCHYGDGGFDQNP